MQQTDSPPASPTCRFFWRSTDDAPPNQWTYFRRTLEHDGRSRVLGHFAADPTARLMINGEVIIARVMRFVRPQITVEAVELSPFLRRGPNSIVVLHHYWGVPTFQRSPGGAPGFSLVIEGESADASWRWRAAEQFEPHEHQVIGRDGARRIRFSQIIDARRIEQAIHEPSFDDRLWQPARRVEHPDWSAPVLKETPPLARHRIDAVRVLAAGRCSTADAGEPPIAKVPMSFLMAQASYEPAAADATAKPGIAFELPAGGEKYVTFDFGTPLHGYLELTIDEAAAGTVLDVAYGELPPRADGSFDPEAVVGGPFGDRLILREGPQRIEIPEERTWRYLMLVSRGAARPVRIAAAACMTSDHPVTILGSFDGGPAHVGQIIKLSLDHARVTMSDAYVDTPGREDAQWLEDIEYRAELAARWFGDVSLRQVTLRHAVEQQAPAGPFRVFAPEDYSTEGVQTLDWGMAWIGMLHDDWMWTGSTDRIHRYFPALERFLAALAKRTDEAGLLSGDATHSDIRIAKRADHGAGERESIANAWHYGYLKKAALLAESVGNVERAAEWRQRAERLRAAFARFIVNDDGGTWVAEVWSPKSGALPSYGQGATVSAVFHGLVDPAVAKAAMASAFPAPEASPPAGVHRWNNPTYAYRVLSTLCAHGFAGVAAAHLAERYRPYLPDGPLPEYFLPEAQPIDPTGSHGWAAVPLLWLHDTVLGLRVTRPGGAALAWQPTDVGWSRSCGTSMTPRGECDVQIDWSERSFSLGLPAGVQCEVALPERLGKPSTEGALAADGLWRWSVRGDRFQVTFR